MEVASNAIAAGNGRREIRLYFMVCYSVDNRAHGKPDCNREASDPAFDTLGAARRLKAAGIEAEQADAIVEVMGDSVNQLVTGERFDTGTAMLHARIDSVQTELQAQTDSMLVEMRADIARSHMILAGFVVAANAQMLAVLGILLNQGVLM